MRLKRMLCVMACIFGAMSASATETLTGKKAEGYQGIWFELGQKSQYGDKYSGGLGTYTANHVPIAIHVPEQKKTFFVYGGTIPGKRHLLIMASYYDHATGTVPRPTIVHDKEGVNDPHDNGALSIDDKGFLWVFVSGRANGRPGFIYKSKKPYDIDSFELVEQRKFMTYPQPWFQPGEGFCFLFTIYSKGRELYWMKSADGLTWNEPQKMAGFGGHYQTSMQRGKHIYTAFNYHPGGSVDKRTNLYFLRSDDFGKSWKNAAGEAIQTPLSDAKNPALVRDYESEGKLVYIQDIGSDIDRAPVILYTVSSDFRPGPTTPPRTWYTAQFEASKWQINEVTTSTHNYDTSALYCERDGTWRIIGPSEPGPQLHGTGGEIVMWTSANEGKRWRREKQLTSNSTRNHSYVRRPVDASPEFYALWADGDADNLSESHLYFCSRAGEVYRLPYKMEGEVFKPEKMP